MSEATNSAQEDFDSSLFPSKAPSIQAASRCFRVHSGESHFEDLSSLAITAVVAIVAREALVCCQCTL